MKKRKTNLQGESAPSKKTPVKSIVDDKENPSEPGKSRNFADCEPVLDANEELILNGLAKAEDWREQKRRKEKRKK